MKYYLQFIKLITKPYIFRLFSFSRDLVLTLKIHKTCAEDAGVSFNTVLGVVGFGA